LLLPAPKLRLEGEVDELPDLAEAEKIMEKYKLDEATGVPYLMEINGRLWGSLQLAIDAGVDFPTMLVAAATGGEPRPVTYYRSDVRSRWWWGDVDHLLLRLQKPFRKYLDFP
jgi:predicted ATP-grasp superfamily ATP-dependent carboligase